MDAEDELLFGISHDSWKAASIVAAILFWSLLVYGIDWLVWWWRGAA